MASDLALTVLRLAYLVLLWALVLGAVSVLRRDIFGTVITPRGKGRSQRDARKALARQRARDANEPPVASSILVTGGPLVGMSIPLSGRDVILGRSPASTLVLSDEFVSSRHARLRLQGDQWWIDDLGSSNGTFVDDERIAEPRAVGVGDNIRVGQTTLELVN